MAANGTCPATTVHLEKSYRCELAAGHDNPDDPRTGPPGQGTPHQSGKWTDPIGAKGPLRWWGVQARLGAPGSSADG